MDNEFELIFVVAFQKILQLSYVDKFLSDIHLEFRDKYKNELVSRENRSYQQYDFLSEFNHILEEAEKWGKWQWKENVKIFPEYIFNANNLFKNILFLQI